jgi:hypothetical protein
MFDFLQDIINPYYLLVIAFSLLPLINSQIKKTAQQRNAPKKQEPEVQATPPSVLKKTEVSTKKTGNNVTKNSVKRNQKKFTESLSGISASTNAPLLNRTENITAVYRRNLRNAFILSEVLGSPKWKET